LTRARENADGGLVLIGTANPSAASSVSFTSLTVGKRYRVNASLLANSAQYLYVRFRENSTDKATNYVGASFFTGANNTSGINWYSNAESTLMPIGDTSSTLYNNLSFDLYVNSLSQGSLHGQEFDVSTSRAVFYGMRNSSMSNFNGFTITISSGNFTGQIKLYEYR
jgi:hypothetical protein